MLNFSNFAVPTNPSSSIAAGDTEIGVASTTDYPSLYPFMIVVFEGANTPESATTKEIMQVTGAGGTKTWAVQRDVDGYNGGGQSFSTSAEVWHIAVADDFSRTLATPQYANIGDGTDNPPWVSVPATDSGSGVATPTDDRVSVAPIDIGHDATIVGIGIELTTAGIETSAGSGQVHLFVYDEKNGLPGTALVNQTVDGTVSGDKKVTGLTQAVSPGRYYLGYWTTGWDTTPEIRTNRDLVCQPAYAKGMGNTWQAQGVVIATGVTSAPTDGTAQSWFIGNEVFPYVHVQVQS